MLNINQLSIKYVSDGIEYEILCVLTFTNYYKFMKYLLYYVCMY